MKKPFILTINIGNTNQSFSLFDSNNCISSNQEIHHLESFITRTNLSAENTLCLVSSVKDSQIPKLPFKAQMIRDFFSDKTFIDMPVDYSSTLGDDRLVVSFHLFHKSQTPKIIIDSGSFTTIDIIDSSGFMGGYILPGLKLIESSYQSGEKLIEHAKKMTNTEVLNLPHNTQEAIQAGIKLTYLAPIEAIIVQYPKHEIYLTGGNAKLLESRFSSRNASIHTDENLVHTALYFIAKWNCTKDR